MFSEVPVVSIKYIPDEGHEVELSTHKQDDDICIQKLHDEDYFPLVKNHHCLRRETNLRAQGNHDVLDQLVRHYNEKTNEYIQALGS